VSVPDDDTWLALTKDELTAGPVHDWAVRRDCGAVALFSGTVRDHAEGRVDVVALEYEAYEEEVVPRLATIADAIRDRWSEIGRIALLHRIGRLGLGEVSVIVAVSAPHRGEAFAAARYGIDTIKSSVPIWKREIWSGGEDWGLGGNVIEDISSESVES